MTASSPAQSGRGRALNLRLFMAMLHTQELLAGYLGVRLGLYSALAECPATAEELARRAGIGARYAREWLEQQAVAGFLDVSDEAEASLRVYTLPADHAEVLLASDSPLSMVSLTMLPLGGVAAALPGLLEAYRTGAGLGDDAYGQDWREGHSGANRALFMHALPGWFRSALPDVSARLRGGPSRVADLGCGAGWAAIAIARAYPWAQVDGFDLDKETIAAAGANAEGAGVADRVVFRAQDAAHADGEYDLVCLFDTLHEMTRPVEVLRACRALRAEEGEVLVLDAKVAPHFTAPADEIERFQYATSVLHCLPVSQLGPGQGGPGTVLRPEAVRDLAVAAGFADAVEVPIGDRFHRMYRLTG
ncbi:methyltransferase domain-containing protein [Nonomuraea purpurea]|uniref:Methyltransferase domain-containing protein n=1 Tax=Nonomuraea purpurea TaxID=1849276 RepID=A0ABV8GJM4_9ACTN